MQLVADQQNKSLGYKQRFHHQQLLAAPVPQFPPKKQQFKEVPGIIQVKRVGSRQNSFKTL